MFIKKSIFLFLFCCLGLDGFGQQIFQKKLFFPGPGAHYGIGLVAEMHDSSLFAHAGGYSSSVVGQRQLIKMNKFGETQWVKTLTDDSSKLIAFNGMTATSNNHLAFYKYKQDTVVVNGLAYIGFSKMAYACADTAGNFIWANVLSDSMTFQTKPYNLFKSNDGNILSGLWFCDYGVVDTTSGAVVTKLDNNGNILFRKKYELNLDNTHDTIYYFNRLVELNDNRLVLCGQILDTAGNNSGAVIIFLDTYGNVLSAHMYDIGLGFFTDIALYESNKLLAIASNIIPSTNNWESTVIEIDSNFNVVKSAKLNRIGPTSFSVDKIFSKSGRYIFAHSDFFLMEADTGLTTLLNAWYYGSGGGAGVSEKLQCLDGGFCLSAGSTAALLSKVDSTLRPPCNLLSSLPYFTISPYSTYYIQDLPVAASVLNSTLTPFNIFTATTSVADTFYCQTATSINAAYHDFSFEVYPNPVIHELIIISKKDCDVVVHDITGKEISVRSIKANTEERLPMLNLKPGVYILNFTANGFSRIKKIIKL